MLYLLVQVNEGAKCVIPERIMSIKSKSNRFSDLFDITTLGQYDDRKVEVFIRREKSEGWQEVDNGLNGDLKMLEVLGFMQVKFCLVPVVNLDTLDLTQNELGVEIDAFTILMRNSKEPLLPQRCTERNNYSRLYNEIIKLFQAQKVGWTNGLHETMGKTFINRLTSALWYIDPHLSTLSARSYHLPALFTQLKTYQDGKSYNEFYYTGHHKKDQLSQQKLAHLSSSLEISISQPWASSNKWSQVMPAVLSLIEILKKYSNYLIAATVSMNELHHSNESARSPENDSTMYQVSACEPYQLKDEYSQLDDLLFEKSFYEHVDVQQYLPNDIVDRYRFMKELQLTFPIGVYRYYQGNYLGKINYIWRIPENKVSNDRQDETLKAHSTLKVEETTQAQIRRHPALVKFMETHCQMRTYSFQVKKCNNPSCLYCKPIRLPPHEFRNLSFLPDPILSKENANHYAAFQQVYGTKTTEEFRPTYIAKSESIPKYILGTIKTNNKAAKHPNE
ncbi:25122_t:CDS:2 [Dentiscutata erythropus]|uniref:25122_t:CDS:1 n=1 Tax=Dentiscutata erythropus TaxID=1348616 RepID=A0A9N9GRT7_9GLOM|nr:25122_t:CDS:2 [Dentiscutata erythropus]